MTSVSPLITITASGYAATVERALGIAVDLAAAGLAVEILAFNDFAPRIDSFGIRFSPSPGDLAGCDAYEEGSPAASRYLASGVPGLPMTLDGRLRDSTMLVMCDDSPLIPSIAEARGLPIYRVPGASGSDPFRYQGVKGWIESIRMWRAVREGVNDMRMFLGLSDFASPRSFRRSITQIPAFSVEAVVPARPTVVPAPEASPPAMANIRSRI